MDKQTSKQLAVAWLAIYESAEADQWELASIAFNAVEVEGDKPAAFAALVGVTVATVWKYRKAFTFRAGIDPIKVDSLTFSDAYVLGQMTDQGAAAVMAVAAGTGGTVSSAAARTTEVQTVRAYLNDNPELVQEVLTDEGTRAAVNQAAFKAATEQLTEKHRGDDAAKRDRVKARKDTIQTANRRLEVDRAMVALMHLERSLSMGLGRIASDLKANYSDELFTADKEAAALELLDQMAAAIDTSRKDITALRIIGAVTF